MENKWNEQRFVHRALVMTTLFTHRSNNKKIYGTNANIHNTHSHIIREMRPECFGIKRRSRQSKRAFHSDADVRLLSFDCSEKENQIEFFSIQMQNSQLLKNKTNKQPNRRDIFSMGIKALYPLFAMLFRKLFSWLRSIALSLQRNSKADCK